MRGERADLRVLPQAEIGVGDAALGGYPGRLEDDQAKTAQREAAEMHEVPVIGIAVARRILAHRGNDGTIAQGQLAQGQRRKQQGHRRDSVDRAAILAHRPFIGK